MKNAFVIFLVIIVFFAFGIVGYLLAVKTGSSPLGSVNVTENVAGKRQHNLAVIQVDQLDNPEPRLVSVWFMSLYFMDSTPPSLAIGQLYPARSDNKMNQSIARSFDLTDAGDLSTGFRRNLDVYHIDWEGYLLVDSTTMQRVLEWINGPGDYTISLSSGADGSASRNQLAGQTCEKVAGIDRRGGTPLEWGDLVPAHFRSNLRMEDALTYWNRVTTASSASCQILPAR